MKQISKTSIQCQCNDYRQMSFSLDGPVIGKGRPRFTRAGHTYTPEKTERYEKAIAKAYRNRYDYCSSKALKVKILVYTRIAKSASKKRKQMMMDDMIKCTKKPDIDNIQKIVLDALNKVAYYDDTQVVQIGVIKKWSEDDRMIVCIEEIGERMQSK